jgi:transglutaminase-like putative cysteine protease
MTFKIEIDLVYATQSPCALLLQIEALSDTNQNIKSEKLDIGGAPVLKKIAGESGLGERIWLHTTKTFQCTYEAIVEVNRKDVGLEDLDHTPLIQLSDVETPYMMGSRYCHPEDFYEFVEGEMSELQGGAFVAAAAGWIRNNFIYDPFASHAGTTATDTFNARKGVCRDYAHVLIAMCRARAIPARMVSCYAPRVTPQDFHAVAEVFLNGSWHLIDATGMATPDEIIRIGVGRDAADVSFMTSYGLMVLKKQTVQVFSL